MHSKLLTFDPQGTRISIQMGDLTYKMPFHCNLGKSFGEPCKVNKPGDPEGFT